MRHMEHSAEKDHDAEPAPGEPEGQDDRFRHG